MRNFIGYVTVKDGTAVRAQCGFCRSTNMNLRTVTCKDCGTTNAGQKLVEKGKKKKNAHNSRGQFSTSSS